MCVAVKGSEGQEQDAGVHEGEPKSMAPANEPNSAEQHDDESDVIEAEPAQRCCYVERE
jgi:hypothetical protein